MGVLTFAAASYAVRTLYRRLERRGVFRIDEDRASQPTAWVDGLRGISALGVVASHLSTCLGSEHFRACCGPDGASPSLWQLPPLRLLAAGHSWLAMFFLLSGFSSALTPLRLARGGRVDAAYSHLGRSAMRRPLRLMLPAAAATLLSWLLCQLRLYTVAKEMHLFLLSTEAPAPSAGGPLAALADLARALVHTWRWLDPDNPYDHMQYALVYMLQGSFLVYGMLLVTLGLRARARVFAVLLVLCASFDWSWRLINPQLELPYLLGLLLAELWLAVGADTLAAMQDRSRESGGSRSSNTARAVAGPVLIVVGAVVMSWPKARAADVGWSLLIEAALVRSAPAVRDPERLAGAVGAALAVLGMVLDALPSKYSIRAMLARRPLLWLGRVSFAVYLLHMTVVRLLLPWALFIRNPLAAVWRLRELHSDAFQACCVSHEPGPVRVAAGLALLLLPAILAAAVLWTRTVEPAVDRAAAALERLATGRDDGAERPNQGQQGSHPYRNHHHHHHQDGIAGASGRGQQAPSLLPVHHDKSKPV